MALEQTSILAPRPEARISPVPHDAVLDLGMPRPWRISLFVNHVQVELILDLTEPVMIGRCDPSTNYYPDLDLRPFDGEKYGISRQHAYLKLDGDTVVVVDNGSSNGTRLNGTSLQAQKPYTLRDGDELMMGALELRIGLLINPLGT